MNGEQAALPAVERLRGQSQEAAAQVELYLSTEGSYGYTREVDGAEYPCVLVTYTGRISGRELTTPVIRVVHQGTYILVGSLGGADWDPQWVLNLRVRPRLILRDRHQAMPMQAQEVTGTLREAYWATAVQTFPPYQQYQKRTGRTIPLFACHPAKGTGAAPG